jgi:hypothetical protein
MDDDDAVIEAARAIRPYLDRLADPPTSAAELDRQLADALNDRSTGRPATARQLRALLEEQEDTAWFLAEVLADAPHCRPPYHQHRYRRHRSAFPVPAGDPGPVDAVRYACPRGDYVWHRPEIGTPVPDCPTHHLPLADSDPGC